MSAEEGKLPEGAQYMSVDVKGVEIDRSVTGAIVLTLDPRHVFGVAVGLSDVENGRSGHFLLTPESLDRKAIALGLARGLKREAASL